MHVGYEQQPSAIALPTHLRHALFVRLRPWLVALALTMHSAWAYHRSAELAEYSDEMFHVPQIQSFCAGHFELDDAITMLPGYHALSAVFARLIHDCSRPALRGFNVLCGLLVTWTAFQITRALRSRYPLTRASAVYFLPLLYPYQFIAFTDASALWLALLAVLLMIKGKFSASGLVACASVLVRQTNIVVLVFMLWVAALERDTQQPWAAQLRVFVRRTWSTLLGCVAFAIFILVNHGVALGDRGYHRAGVHVGNVYFCLFLLTFTSLPVGLATLWQRRSVLTSNVFIASLMLATVVYMTSFDVTHHYNSILTFLRNVLLHWAVRDPLTRTLFFIPALLGLAITCLTRFSRPAFWVWLPISLLTLLPEGLIEQRYALLPIALLTVLRKDASPAAEGLAVVSNAAISITLLLVLADGTWSL